MALGNEPVSALKIQPRTHIPLRCAQRQCRLQTEATHRRLRHRPEAGAL